MITEPFEIIVPGKLIKVCMECFPGTAIFEIFPDLAGLAISHGTCPGHRARWASNLKRVQDAKAATSLRFGDLMPGDCFRLLGCDGEDLELRKADGHRAFNIQDGVWRDVSKGWPVVRTDNIRDSVPGHLPETGHTELLPKRGVVITSALIREIENEE